jgi:hypothetical protein
MPIVRFTWNPQLIDVRRQACPRARWDKAARAWTMTTAEAEAFIAASHARMDFTRESTTISIDQERWLIGFARGAPFRQTK